MRNERKRLSWIFALALALCLAVGGAPALAQGGESDATAGPTAEETTPGEEVTEPDAAPSVADTLLTMETVNMWMERAIASTNTAIKSGNYASIGNLEQVTADLSSDLVEGDKVYQAEISVTDPDVPLLEGDTGGDGAGFAIVGNIVEHLYDASQASSSQISALGSVTKSIFANDTSASKKPMGNCGDPVGNCGDPGQWAIYFSSQTDGRKLFVTGDLTKDSNAISQFVTYLGFSANLNNLGNCIGSYFALRVVPKTGDSTFTFSGGGSLYYVFSFVEGEKAPSPGPGPAPAPNPNTPPTQQQTPSASDIANSAISPTVKDEVAEAAKDFAEVEIATPVVDPESGKATVAVNVEITDETASVEVASHGVVSNILQSAQTAVKRAKTASAKSLDNEEITLANLKTAKPSQIDDFSLRCLQAAASIETQVLASTNSAPESLGDLVDKVATIEVTTNEKWEAAKSTVVYKIAFTKDTALEDAIEAANAALAKVESLKEADYTQPSWQALQTAVSALNTALANDEATAEEIQSATKAVLDAIDALQQEQVSPEPTPTPTPTAAIYRFYNPYDRIHLYTADAAEIANLKKLGWQEDYGKPMWHAPASPVEGGKVIYRFFNPWTGDHYYCPEDDTVQLAKLKRDGWVQDSAKSNIYSGPAVASLAVSTLFNPYEQVDTHLYTTDVNEIATLVVPGGWRSETVVIYGVEPSAQ